MVQHKNLTHDAAYPWCNCIVPGDNNDNEQEGGAGYQTKPTYDGVSARCVATENGRCTSAKGHSREAGEARYHTEYKADSVDIHKYI